MGLAGTTWREEVPDEPGEYVEFRRLSSPQLQEAADVKAGAARARFNELPEETKARILDRQVQASPEPVAAVVEDDPLDSMDVATLLKHGVMSWSYADPVTDPFAQLDGPTAEWCARRILAKMRPRSDDDRKNGSSPSTPTSEALKV